jgi:hypothetical protein
MPQLLCRKQMRLLVRRNQFVDGAVYLLPPLDK